MIQWQAYFTQIVTKTTAGSKKGGLIQLVVLYLSQNHGKCGGFEWCLFNFVEMKFWLNMAKYS